MRWSVLVRSVATAAVSAVALCASPAAYASGNDLQYRVPSSLSLSHKISDTELKQVEHDLRVIFDVYLTRGADGWIVHESRVADSRVKVEDLRAIAANLNRAESGPQVRSIGVIGGSAGLGQSVSPDYAFGSQAYLRCVLDYTGFGFLFGTVSGGGGGLVAFLAAKRWADAALVLVKLVGVGALRGGVAGLAASLAAAAAWCATPWAR